MTESLILPCTCGTLNRVPRPRLGDGPVCADCRKPLIGGPPLELSSGDFDRFVGRSDLPVVVDFWAEWCGPCKVMGPYFAEAAARLTGSARFVKVDTEANADLAARFQITGIPTIAAFVRGSEVARHSGVMGAGDIVTWVSGLPGVTWQGAS